jgi:RNA recognition motif-containing protein
VDEAGLNITHIIHNNSISISQPAMTDAARWKSTVHVGGLAAMVTAANVHDAFIPFGEIVDVNVPKNDKPNSPEAHRGFAYVEYEDVEDAKEAIDNMNQSEFFGRTISVSAAKVPKSAEEGLGSKKAVWEQVRLTSVKLHTAAGADMTTGRVAR